MIQIPADLAKLYTSFMEQKGVETDQHRYYIKRKQAHHAVSLFYEMGHLSGRKTRNGTSYGKNAAYGRTEPEISSSHTKKAAFNQTVFSGRIIIPQTSKPGSDTNMAPGQSEADWTGVFNELKTAVKMRHYSPKTLKTYSGWVRKFLLSNAAVYKFQRFLSVQKNGRIKSESVASLLRNGWPE